MVYQRDELHVFRLEVKFDPDKIGNFVTGFAKVGGGSWLVAALLPVIARAKFDRTL